MKVEQGPNAKGQGEQNPLLKLALEMGPLAVFFLANSRGAQLAEAFPGLQALGGPIFIATAAFMVAITISLGVSYYLTRALPIMPLVSGGVVLVFGALTLFLQNDLFIKLKPTIVNCLFGSVLLGGLFFGKSLLGYVFDSAFKLDAEGWRKLTLRWGLFFFVLAAINEFVWRTFSTDFWVQFKVFGFMPITIAFTLAQLPLLQKHALEDEAPQQAD
ncbi:septation protein A [Polycladidibacter hongkongensis]|uniref:septation protein A n=1 Tax=Polycladidibacter hongkongensis TaxID=1647556 RepID=UPI00082C069E|nr:septation protein A [Pseudovibrio hongkongensis]